MTFFLLAEKEYSKLQSFLQKDYVKSVDLLIEKTLSSKNDKINIVSLIKSTKKSSIIKNDKHMIINLSNLEKFKKNLEYKDIFFV